MRLAAFLRALSGDPFRDAWQWWSDDDNRALDDVHAYEWGWTLGHRVRNIIRRVHSGVL